MYHKNYVLILLILASCTQGAVAQEFFSRGIFSKDFYAGRMEAGFQIGASHYIGELNNTIYGFEPFSKEFSKNSAGLSLKYHFNKISEKDRTWGVRLDGNFTRIKANDKDSNDPAKKNRGLAFENNLWELAAMGEFHFFNFRPYRSTKLFSPYVFAGAGAIYNQPQPGVAGSEAFFPIIPFGTGVKLNWSGPWSWGIELNYRYVFSDFLDGIGNKEYAISTKFPLDPNRRLSYNDRRFIVLDPAGPSSPSGVTSKVISGEKGNDFFMTTVLKVSYTFYKWRDPIWK